MRLKSAIWVSAYIRRCETGGAFAAVRRRGAEAAGAIFVKLTLPENMAQVFSPAPQSSYDEARPSDRTFMPMFSELVDDKTAEDRLARESRFDSDCWIVEIEDRQGRHWLDLAK